MVSAASAAGSAGGSGSGPAPPWRDRLYFEYAYVRGIRTENLKYVDRAKGAGRAGV